MNDQAAVQGRRSVVAALAAAAGLALAGCSPSGKQQASQSRAPKPNVPATPAAAMTVYRDPNCGCCEAWAGIARNAGYQVQLIDRPDMPAVKRQYGVPEELLSCHTAIVGGYAVEGHVPMNDIRRLLSAKPAGVRGIAVAGMPLGSPGMEVPDGTSQPFQVMVFDAAGNSRPFSV